MATIGLSKPYFALYNNNSGVVTYTGAAPIGKAVTLNLELEGDESNILYADNGPAESVNTFAGGTITLSTDDLLPEPMISIYGVKKEAMSISGVQTEGASWLIFDDDQNTPYGGFGAIMKKQQNNVTKWVAIVFTKIQFQNMNEAATTQGETIEWQTPELTATLMRDDTSKHEWKRISTPLDTEAEAEAAIKSFFGVAE